MPALRSQHHLPCLLLSHPQAALYDVDSDDHLLLLADVFPTTLTQQLANLEEQGMAMGPGGCPYQDISDAPYYAIEVRAVGLVAGRAGAWAAGVGKPAAAV